MRPACSKSSSKQHPFSFSPSFPLYLALFFVCPLDWFNYWTEIVRGNASVAPLAITMQVATQRNRQKTNEKRRDGCYLLCVASFPKVKTVFSLCPATCPSLIYDLQGLLRMRHCEGAIVSACPFLSELPASAALPTINGLS